MKETLRRCARAAAGLGSMEVVENMADALGIHLREPS